MNAPRVIVTGANGFVGRRLCSWLVQHDCQVTALVRRAGTAPADADREHQWSDLDASKAQYEGLEGAHTVVHCAGLAHLLGPEATDTEQRFRQTNVLLTERLALQAAKAGVRRLVFLSSIKVNGESTDRRSAFSETDLPSPSDAYARSKAEAERRLREIGAERGLEIVIIRPPLVYGPGVSANLYRLLQLVGKGVPLPLGAVRNCRSMIGIDNLCDLIMRCVEHPAAADQVFLAADDEDLSTPGLIRLIAAGLERPARLIPVPTALVRRTATLLGRRSEAERLLGSLQVDVSKAKRLLDWTPPMTTEVGITQMAAWYRARSTG